MIDEKKVELMKKLQRLAERGVGGEKEGTQKKLQQLMKKYDIEESDLSDDKLEDHEWKYHNDFELRLLGFCTIRKHNSNNVRRLRQRR